MKTILIFANGTLKNRKKAEALAAAADTIICADGGAVHCARLGLLPDLLIGDLDSTPKKLRRTLAENGVKIEQYPTAKNSTDLELAVASALAIRGKKEIHLLAATGGRLDMTLATLLLPTARRHRKAAIVIHGTNEVCRLLTPGRHTICGRPGQQISFLPLKTVKKLDLRGVAWSADGLTLKLGSARGVSNRMEKKRCVVRFTRGLLLMVLSK